MKASGESFTALQKSFPKSVNVRQVTSISSTSLPGESEGWPGERERGGGEGGWPGEREREGKVVGRERERGGKAVGRERERERGRRLAGRERGGKAGGRERERERGRRLAGRE